jgi:hypothetical protein
VALGSMVLQVLHMFEASQMIGLARKRGEMIFELWKVRAVSELNQIPSESEVGQDRNDDVGG